MSVDFYNILEVAPNADAEEIKRAFRRLAKLYHPDVSADPNASERFKLVYTAYDILQDPVKRKVYDEYRVTKPVFMEDEDRPMTPAERADPYFSKYRRWEREAARQAQTYSQMDYGKFEESLLDKVSFHATQFLVLLIFFPVLVLGFVLLFVSYNLLVEKSFGGSQISGYVALVAGLILVFTAGRTIWLVFDTWRDRKSATSNE